MSNGIGKKHLENNLEFILDNDRVMVKKKDHIIYAKAFKYYLRLLTEKYGYEDRVTKIKETREQDYKDAMEITLARNKTGEETINNTKLYMAERQIKNQIRGYEHG